MKISLITPAGRRSKSGTRATAARWAGILRGFGHRVRVAESHGGERADMMVALHAWRSAESVLRFREKYPTRPLVVALTVVPALTSVLYRKGRKQKSVSGGPVAAIYGAFCTRLADPRPGGLLTKLGFVLLVEIGRAHV